MKRNFKTLFAKVQGVIQRGTVATLCIILIGFFTVAGCKEPRALRSSQSDNSALLITRQTTIDSLFKNGDTTSSLLIGEWHCIKFSYTTNSKAIADVDTICKGLVKIPDTENLWLLHTNEIHFDCSISNGKIKASQRGSTYVLSPQEEDDIVKALANAYRYTVTDKWLIICFTGQQSRNLLILTR
jgi:hypothetical protein